MPWGDQGVRRSASAGRRRTTCIIGAGLLSIPMAFSLLGAAGGTAVFVAVVRTRRACVALHVLW